MDDLKSFSSLDDLGTLHSRKYYFLSALVQVEEALHIKETEDKILSLKIGGGLVSNLQIDTLI